MRRRFRSIKLFYFGLGNDSTLPGQSVFGMSQTIVGASAIKPVYEWQAIRRLNLSLLGEVNGRFVSLRGNHGESEPSIETLYSEATAPGLASQPSMIQFGEGMRIKPTLAGRLQLNYLGNFQQFAASSDSRHSFMRWTVDLNHTFALYGKTQSAEVNNSDRTRPRRVRQTRPEVPVRISFEKLERLHFLSLVADGVVRVVKKYRSFLFSAHARWIRYQWVIGARELSGLPLPGTKRIASARGFRAFHLGSSRYHLFGRPGRGRQCAR